MARILVTGATGFLGHAIVDQLTASHDVISTGRSPISQVNLPNYRSVDLSNPDSMQSLLKNTDSVIHAAGKAHQFQTTAADRQSFFDLNATATFKLAQAASQAGVKRFVFISSVSVYGSSFNNVVDEQTSCVPEDDYGASKKEGEELLIQLAKKTSMEIVILRPVLLYGEEDKGNMKRLIEAIASGRFVWIGKGETRKTLIHRDDMAQACLLAATSSLKSSGAIYNVSASPVRMQEIVESISLALNRRSPRLHIPAAPVVWTLNAAQLTGLEKVKRIRRTVNKWLQDVVVDGTRIEQELGFVPQVSLREGMQREVDWWLTQQTHKVAA